MYFTVFNSAHRTFFRFISWFPAHKFFVRLTLAFYPVARRLEVATMR